MGIKRERQNTILKIIKENFISTQEELMEHLCKAGFDVTQATASRDIKQLHLLKKQDIHGRFFYSSSSSDLYNFAIKIKSIIYDAVLWVESAKNICVVKCYTGMANAACAAIDSMNLENVVGSIAGDDTIFICCRTDQNALELKDIITNMTDR